jgi:hypothetical protein
VDGEGFEPPKECLQLIYSQSPLAAWVTVRTTELSSRCLLEIEPVPQKSPDRQPAT